jgi:BlaI family transcriptional regulator, penicillinase repressor
MNKKPIASLGKAESEVLGVLWQLGEASVQQVLDNLPPGREIEYVTVQTMLRRLRDKGFVRHRVEGKAHVFYPAINPQKVMKKTVWDLVDRLFGGDPVPLALHLFQHRRMRPEDIRHLQKVISEQASKKEE